MTEKIEITDSERKLHSKASEECISVVFAMTMAKYGRDRFQSSIGELDCRCRGIPILNTYIWSKFTKKWIQLIGKLGYEIKKTSGKTSIQNLVRRRRFSMF